ncbi:MAG TPA: hypothetical protein VFT71_00065 [Candidatus Nitrosocosmicus sp.]|nr:hypothetical protein [Candidatus Nitrosocosmicus sp.]
MDRKNGKLKLRGIKSIRSSIFEGIITIVGGVTRTVNIMKISVSWFISLWRNISRWFCRMEKRDPVYVRTLKGKISNQRNRFIDE